MQTCTVCGQSKEAEAFGFRNQATGRRHRKCKACVAAYGREHYSANRVTYVSRNNKRSRAHTRALKAKVWDHLLCHPCVDCGVADPVVLEFDHDDRAAKRKTIHRLVHQAYSWEAVAAEIAKCDVRCANCHRRRTAAQFTWPKLNYRMDEAGSKTAAARQVLRRPALPRNGTANVKQLTPELSAAGYRLCGWCGHAKTLEEFHLRNKLAGKRNTVCSECFTGYRREHYRLNREAYIKRNSRLLRERGRLWSRRLWEYLRTHSCLDCGESDPLVLEFDHVDVSNKRAVVGFLAHGGYPWDAVAAVLAKCEIRCANCHRRQTARQFDWPKLALSAPANHM